MVYGTKFESVTTTIKKKFESVTTTTKKKFESVTTMTKKFESVTTTTKKKFESVTTMTKKFESVTTMTRKKTQLKHPSSVIQFQLKRKIKKVLKLLALWMPDFGTQVLSLILCYSEDLLL